MAAGDQDHGRYGAAGAGGEDLGVHGIEKNLAGAFHPPQRMVVCTAFLASLPSRQLESGRWELLKTALLEGDAAWAERILDEATPAEPSLV
ncbi:MAG: hypothetical protein WCO77_04980, partial [bacterium]